MLRICLFYFLLHRSSKGKVKSGFLCLFFQWGLKKRCFFCFGSNYINPEKESPGLFLINSEVWRFNKTTECFLLSACIVWQVINWNMKIVQNRTISGTSALFLKRRGANVTLVLPRGYQFYIKADSFSTRTVLKLIAIVYSKEPCLWRLFSEHLCLEFSM